MLLRVGRRDGRTLGTCFADGYVGARDGKKENKRKTAVYKIGLSRKNAQLD